MPVIPAVAACADLQHANDMISDARSFSTCGDGGMCRLVFNAMVAACFAHACRRKQF